MIWTLCSSILSDAFRLTVQTLKLGVVDGVVLSRSLGTTERQGAGDFVEGTTFRLRHEEVDEDYGGHQDASEEQVGVGLKGILQPHRKKDFSVEEKIQENIK